MKVKEHLPIISATIIFAIVVVIGCESVSSLGYPVGSDNELGSVIGVIAIASAVFIMSYIVIWGTIKLLTKK